MYVVYHKVAGSELSFPVRSQCVDRGGRQVRTWRIVQLPFSVLSIHCMSGVFIRDVSNSGNKLDFSVSIRSLLCN